MNNELMEWALHIFREAKKLNWRTGQYLFNILPHGPAEAVRGTLFDPFRKELSVDQIMTWISEHLIFGEPDEDKRVFTKDRVPREIIAVFDGNNLLWSSDWTLTTK